MKQRKHWIVPAGPRSSHRATVRRSSACGDSRLVVGGTWLGLLLGLLLVISGALMAPLASARDLGGASGSEGQGSLPSFSSGSGLAFVGNIQDITAVLGSSSGTGDVEFYALDPKVSMAIVRGNLQLSIDLNELSSRDVEAHLVLGDALSTGIAEVGYGAWNSGLFVLPLFSFELPLSSLFASQDGSAGSTGSGSHDLRIRALGHDGDQYDLRVHRSAGTLSMGQIVR